MISFDSSGKQNTEAAVQIAVKKAKELNTEIVIASSTGATAKEMLKAAKQLDYQGRMIVVRTVSSATSQGQNKMDPSVKKDLEEAGMTIITAGHALSSGERGISTKFQGAYPLEMMAFTLRTFGQGVKVCFECAVMALDGDAIPYDKPIVSIAGTGGGADTVVVMTPSYSATLLATRIHEILCKPSLLK